ncbi:MAG: hypothetical protein H6R17_1791 [Proteobacteria bacterium]|nr:hypothetical protein [Pseudomonadota bacterium]
MTPHLFVDISSHGLGHLAQTAPILNELFSRLPELRLTVRSGLPQAKLRERISGELTHLEGRSDFGYVMHDAIRIDHAATALAYRAQHADWAHAVAAEAALLATLAPDLVLSDVAYLPLAGAAQAGIPALSMCSLNWADLFAHFFGNEAWAAPIHRQMLAAYRSAECFLRLTPAMAMEALPRRRAIAPVAALGRRIALRERLGYAADDKIVLVAFGGFDTDLAAEHWPRSAGLRWLIPQSWPLARDDMSAFEALDLPFTDLLHSVDAVLTKPGYGTFTEAACNGTPVLYLRRDDWPEQDCLIDWLKLNARCVEIGKDELTSGQLQSALAALWQQSSPPAPLADGAAEAAALLVTYLERADRRRLSA